MDLFCCCHQFGIQQKQVRAASWGICVTQKCGVEPCVSEEELKEAENHSHMYLLPVCPEGQGTVEKAKQTLGSFQLNSFRLSSSLCCLTRWRSCSAACLGECALLRKYLFVS